MGSNNCFSKIIVDVFPPWHCVNTHLKAPEQQTANSAHTCWWSINQMHSINKSWMQLTFLIPIKVVMAYVVFDTLLLHFVWVLEKIDNYSGVIFHMLSFT